MVQWASEISLSGPVSDTKKHKGLVYFAFIFCLSLLLIKDSS